MGPRSIRRIGGTFPELKTPQTNSFNATTGGLDCGRGMAGVLISADVSESANILGVNKPRRFTRF